MGPSDALLLHLIPVLISGFSAGRLGSAQAGCAACTVLAALHRKVRAPLRVNRGSHPELSHLPVPLFSWHREFPWHLPPPTLSPLQNSLRKRLRQARNWHSVADGVALPAWLCQLYLDSLPARLDPTSTLPRIMPVTV